MNIDDKVKEISKSQPVYILLLNKAVAVPLLIVFVCLVLTTFAWTKEAVADALAKYRCSSFEYQEDAQVAFWQGATQLDGNDKDGKACEHLPRLTK